MALGRARSARVQEAQRCAQELLAAEAQQVEERRKRIEASARTIWGTLDAIEIRDAKRDANLAKARARFDSDSARIADDHARDVDDLQRTCAAAVVQLRADGKSAQEIAALTGLTGPQIRDALARTGSRSNRSRKLTTPETTEALADDSVGHTPEQEVGKGR